MIDECEYRFTFFQVCWLAIHSYLILKKNILFQNSFIKLIKLSLPSRNEGLQQCNMP